MNQHLVLGPSRWSQRGLAQLTASSVCSLLRYFGSKRRGQVNS
jgi:hypothetical protein